jgi:hypothetical protein
MLIIHCGLPKMPVWLISEEICASSKFACGDDSDSIQQAAAHVQEHSCWQRQLVQQAHTMLHTAAQPLQSADIHITVTK